MHAEELRAGHVLSSFQTSERTMRTRFVPVCQGYGRKVRGWIAAPLTWLAMTTNWNLGHCEPSEVIQGGWDAACFDKLSTNGEW